jgi:pimeloyl-ACP methyl ester carboxylesterase
MPTHEPSDHRLTGRELSPVLRGLRRGVVAWGPEDGPLALLLHGWLDQGAAWQRVAWRLARDGWLVVAPDHRGHGRSDPAPPGSSYHFTEYVVDVDHLVHWLDRPVQALVGHSMGGTIASLYAGLRPESAAHVVLLEGLGPAAGDPESAADQLLAHLDHQREPRTQRTMTDVPAAAERLRRLTPGLGDALALALADRTTQPQPGGGVRWSWDPMHRTRAAVAYDAKRHHAILGRIQAPVDLVMGTRSWYTKLPDLDARAAAIPGLRARHDLDAGHALHVDAAPQVAALVSSGPGAG